MCKIKIIDSIMGSGKTTWAIDYINQNRNKNFVYITPYLDEIKRVRESTNYKLKEPTYKGSSKTDNFHKLLANEESICSTHALFKNANNITREALSSGEYILILDEVMDVVEEMQNFTKDDLATLINDELAYIENDFLIWNDNKLDYQGRFDDIKNMALNNNIICLGEKLIFWNFPIDIFDCFKEVYILTYMFDCQIQRYYYDFFNVDYVKFQVDNDNKLIDYSKKNDILSRQKLIGLINIYDGKLNTIGETNNALSKTWFDNDDGTRCTTLNKHLINWFNNINRGSKPSLRLWTTFKDYKTKLKGKGYTKQFIPLNIRATNQYKECSVLAYCCNRYVKPTVSLFFNKRNITIDQDNFALSEMLQWIWRSRIREGKPIEIYIPSKRMRELLKKYLQPLK